MPSRWSIWSVAAVLHAVVKTTLGFGIVRGVLGIGESGNFPAAVKATAEWFPKKERALATGIFNSGTSIGAVIAPIMVPWLLGIYGWRLYIFNYRRPGVYMAGIMAAFLPDPITS